MPWRTVIPVPLTQKLRSRKPEQVQEIEKKCYSKKNNEGIVEKKARQMESGTDS